MINKGDAAMRWMVFAVVCIVAQVGHAVDEDTEEANHFIARELSLKSAEGKTITANVIGFYDTGVRISPVGENKSYYLDWSKFDGETTGKLKAFRKENTSEAEGVAFEESFKAVYDKFEESLTIRPVDVGKPNVTFFPVVTCLKGQAPVLLVFSSYSGEDWIFTKSVGVKVGKARFDQDLEEVKSDSVDDGVIELYAANADKKMIATLRDAAKGRSVSIRVRGSDGHYDVEVDRHFRDTCKAMLQVYDQMTKDTGEWFDKYAD